MLSVLTPRKKKGTGYKDTLGGAEYLYYLDWGDGILMCAYFQTHPIVQVKYVQFLEYRLHLNKVGVFLLRINFGRNWEVSVLSLQLFSKSKIIPNEFYLLNGALVSSPPEADTETRI